MKMIASAIVTLAASFAFANPPAATAPTKGAEHPAGHAATATTTTTTATTTKTTCEGKTGAELAKCEKDAKAASKKK